MKKNIFLVCYGAGHINLIEPIVDKLILNENYNVKLLALTTAYNKVKNKYTKDVLKNIKDYLFLFDENLDEILKNGLKIFEDNYNASSGLSKLEVLFYIGLSLTEEINKTSYDTAYSNYQEKGRKSFLPVDTIGKILEHENTDLLISTTSPRFEKASLLASKKRNIKSIQILDLFDDDINKPIADYTIVMNEKVKNNLLEKGFKSNQVLIFGQPAIERSVNSIFGMDENLILDKVKLDRKKKVLVYLSQPPLKFNKIDNSYSRVDYKEINPHIFKMLHSMTNEYNVLFRLHPNEDITDYEESFTQYPDIRYTNNELNLFEVICIGDIIVTPYSTVAIEAVSSNKKVFTYKPDYNEFYPISFFKELPFIYSNSFNELRDNLRNKKIINELNSSIEFLTFNFAEKLEKFINSI
ncbi:CDP-glycerol glycerophosphotransferase family protein [Tenacibaculum amylolyticum]|uniref:CDP-glycerol glycerophosphotransferase family protein n=1 Tax=Tenacibaculum amylolyticum TaxID=104269 RepID=UPI003892E163